MRIDENGKTKVSKKIKGGELLPVIDINNKNISTVFSADVSHVEVTYYHNVIVIGNGNYMYRFHS